MTCNHCQSEETIYTIKLIPTNRQDSFFPKYIPQIKATCKQCEKFIKFAPQTPEIIELVNNQLAGIIFALEFAEKHKNKNQTQFSDWLSK